MKKGLFTEYSFRSFMGRQSTPIVPVVLFGLFFILLIGLPVNGFSQTGEPGCETESPDPNPVVTPGCPDNFIMVLDESGSIRGNGEDKLDIANELRFAVLEFLRSMADKGPEAAIIDFNTAARTPIGYTPVTTASLAPGGIFYEYLLADTTDGGNPDFNRYDPEDYEYPHNYTNWEGAFNEVEKVNEVKLAEHVILFTDGNPTAYVASNGDNICPSGPGSDMCRETSLCMSGGAADRVKEQGSHIFIIGFGNPELTEENIQELSGTDRYPDIQSDFYEADYLEIPSLPQLLDYFLRVAAELCGIDLALSKTVDNNTPSVGEEVTFTITVTNEGSNLSSSTTVEDILPEDLSFISSNASQGSYDENTGLWNVGMLDSQGGSPSLQITAKVLNIGEITNYAQVKSADPKEDVDSTPGNGPQDPDEDDDDSVTLVVEPDFIDLSLIKTVDNNTPELGEEVTFTIELTNSGLLDATGVEVEDILPTGLSYVSSNTSNGVYDQNTGIWTLANAIPANGGQATLTITAIINTSEPLNNYAQVHKADQPDPDSSPGNGPQNPDEDDDDEVGLQAELDCPVAIAGNAQTICSGETALLSEAAVGGGATSAVWSISSSPTDGDGILEQPGPEGNPNEATFMATVAGQYTLLLTTNDLGDCPAAVDSLVVTVTPLATVDAGESMERCNDALTGTLSGSFGGGASSARWSIVGTTGDVNGISLSDVNSPTAEYELQLNTPAGNGSITLRLTTNDPDGPCEAVSDEITITVFSGAVVEAGEPKSICAGQEVILSDASIGGGATEATWTITSSPEGNDATLEQSGPDSDPADAVFKATTAGQYTLMLSTNDPEGSCPAGLDSLVITVTPLATVDAGESIELCNDALTGTLSGNFGGGASSARWSVVGTSGEVNGISLSDVNSPTAEYNIQLDAPTGSGSITLRLTTNDPEGPCGTVSDEVTLTVYSEALVDAGEPQSICAGLDLILNKAFVGGGAKEGFWSIASSPEGSDGAINGATFKATVPGFYTLRLTTDDPEGPCPAVFDEVIIEVLEGDIALETTDAQDTIPRCEDMAEVSATFTLSDCLGPDKDSIQVEGFGQFADLPIVLYEETTNIADQMSYTIGTSEGKTLMAGPTDVDTDFFQITYKDQQDSLFVRIEKEGEDNTGPEIHLPGKTLWYVPNCENCVEINVIFYATDDCDSLVTPIITSINGVDGVLAEADEWVQTIGEMGELQLLVKCAEPGIYQVNLEATDSDSLTTTSTYSFEVKGIVMPELNYCLNEKNETQECSAEVNIQFEEGKLCVGTNVELRKVLLSLNGEEAEDHTDKLYTVEVENGFYTLASIPGQGLPVGNHYFNLRLADRHGNLFFRQIEFSINDCKTPAPICFGNLSVDLMPVIENKEIVGGMNEIWATDFVASGVLDCTPHPDADLIPGSENDIRYYAVRQDELIAAGLEHPTVDYLSEDYRSVFFDCKDVGAAVPVFLIGEDGAGNFDYCTILVDVRPGVDPNPCVGEPIDTTERIAIAGFINTPQGYGVENVEIALSGQLEQSMLTGSEGGYYFEDLLKAYDYSVTPSRNDNPKNGVSTLDLVLISKHIIGLEKLDSPYKLLAADVNNSGTVTTFDIIQIRKLILSLSNDFGNTNSWNFVPKDHAFSDPEFPWEDEIPSTLNLNNLTEDVLEGDFVAIKKGDVNENARASSRMTTPRHVAGTFQISTPEVVMEAGKEYTIAFKAKELEEVMGYQFTLNFDESALELLDINYGLAKAEHFGLAYIAEGHITTSWSDIARLRLPSTGRQKLTGTLFSLVVRAKSDALLSDLLNINSRYTSAEAYSTSNEQLDVQLTFGAEKEATSGFELYQNMPNPFVSETQISFNLPKASEAVITIHDVSGKRLNMIRGAFVKGYNTVNLDNLPKGVLYYTLKSGDFIATKKMINLQ